MVTSSASVKDGVMTITLTNMSLEDTVENNQLSLEIPPCSVVSVTLK